MIHALFCLALPLLGGCSDFVQYAPTIAQLTKNQAYYSGKPVEVTGRVEHLDRWTSYSGGYHYEVFNVCQDGCVRVFMESEAPLRNGGRATVRGTYFSAYQSGKDVYRNEIEATEILPER